MECYWLKMCLNVFSCLEQNPQAHLTNVMAVLSEGQLESDVTMTVVVYIKNFTSQLLASIPGD